MKRSAIALTAVIAVATGASACGADDDGDVSPTAASTLASTPTDVAETTTPMPVPGAFFGTASSVAGRMIEGTRCWANICVDMVGPVTLPEAVAIATGEAIDLLFEGVQPTEVSFAWVDVDTVDPRPGTGGTVAWPVAVTDYTPGDAIVTPAGAGDYVLTVFAKWDGAGDIVFSSYFAVR